MDGVTAQLAHLNVNSSGNAGASTHNPHMGNGAQQRLRNKRSQRFTVPVQPPHPAASPPFSNSDESSGAATTSSDARLFGHHHPSSHVSMSSSGISASSLDSLATPPGMLGYNAGAGNDGKPAFGQISSSSFGPAAGAPLPAFLQHDPFANAGGLGPIGSNSNRSRTLSTASSYSQSAWSDSHQQHHHQQQHGPPHHPAGQYGGLQQQQGGAFDAYSTQQQSASHHSIGQSRGGTASFPSSGFDQQQHFPQGPSSFQHNQPPPSLQQQQQHQQQLNHNTIHQQQGPYPPPSQSSSNPAAGSDNNSDDVIPTAIVIKNIPFSFPSTSLLQIIEELTLAPPYAFNYHYDMGVFRGLAFANFHNPQETDACVAALNGFEIQGRKLRVEYKKVLQAGEKERIERDKAIKRMRSMQLERERLLHQQAQLQQQFLNVQHLPPPLPNPPPQFQSQLSPQSQQSYQQAPSSFNNNNNSNNPSLPQPSTINEETWEDYGRAAYTSHSAFGDNVFGAVVGQGFGPGQSNTSVTSSSDLPVSSGASSSGRSSTGPYELDMNDPQTLEIYSRVLLFKDDGMRDELAFSRSLNASQRRTVHLIAQKLGLEHRSVGTGDDRFVLVLKSANGADAQQQRLRSRASTHHLLSPDGMHPQQSNMRKKSMPDLRYQQTHPYAMQQQQQQMHHAGNAASPPPPVPPIPAAAVSNTSLTPRQSQVDLKSGNRRSGLFTAPGLSDLSVPPVPALPLTIPSSASSPALPGSLSAITTSNIQTASSGPPSATSNRQSLLFGSAPFDLETNSKLSKAVGSPVTSPNSSIPSQTQQQPTPTLHSLMRQPRGPEEGASWVRAAGSSNTGEGTAHCELKRRSTCANASGRIADI